MFYLKDDDNFVNPGIVVVNDTLLTFVVVFENIYYMFYFLLVLFDYMNGITEYSATMAFKF